MIYKKIESLCKERNISIRALEVACEISNGTIRQWKKSNPRVDSLKKVCDYFGITLDEITN